MHLGLQDCIISGIRNAVCALAQRHMVVCGVVVSIWAVWAALGFVMHESVSCVVCCNGSLLTLSQLLYTLTGRTGPGGYCRCFAACSRLSEWLGVVVTEQVAAVVGCEC